MTGETKDPDSLYRSQGRGQRKSPERSPDGWLLCESQGCRLERDCQMFIACSTESQWKPSEVIPRLCGAPFTFPHLAFVFTILSVTSVLQIKTRCAPTPSCGCFSTAPSEPLRPQVTAAIMWLPAGGRCSNPSAESMSQYYCPARVTYGYFPLLESAG